MIMYSDGPTYLSKRLTKFHDILCYTAILYFITGFCDNVHDFRMTEFIFTCIPGFCCHRAMVQPSECSISHRPQ